MKISIPRAIRCWDETPVYFLRMRDSLGNSLYVLLVCGTVLLVSLITMRAEAAEGLPEGCHTATTAEIAAGAPAGYPVCPLDTTAGINEEVGQAKQYLASIIRGGTCGPHRTSVDPLDPKFAICAARFLKDVRARDGNVYIISAYRNTAHQACVCSKVSGPCASPGRSKHQLGIAIDLSNGQYVLPSWIHAMAPGYGVRFPVRNDSGHMEPTPNSNCADPNFTPTETGQDAVAPSSGISDSIRELLGLNNTPSQQQSESMCELPDGLRVPCSSIANQGAFGSPPGQTTSLGGAAIPAQPLPTSQQPLQYLPPPTPVSNMILPEIPQTPASATSSTTTLTTFERIMRFAEATRVAHPAATSAPLILTTSIYDIAKIQPDTSSITPIQEIDTYESPMPPARPDTFVSPELGGMSLPHEPQPTLYQVALAEMRSTLFTMLEYLKPFGRPVHEQEGGQYEVYFE